jgi:hypothetical protein
MPDIQVEANCEKFANMLNGLQRLRGSRALLIII